MGVNNLSAPLRHLHAADMTSSCSKQGGQMCSYPRGMRSQTRHFPQKELALSRPSTTRPMWYRLWRIGACTCLFLPRTFIFAPGLVLGCVVVTDCVCTCLALIFQDTLDVHASWCPRSPPHLNRFTAEVHAHAVTCESNQLLQQVRPYNLYRAPQVRLRGHQYKRRKTGTNTN